MTTPNQIYEWFNTGVSLNRDRMLVVCDGFSHEDYPVWLNDANFWEQYPTYTKGMQTVMEVYDLHAAPGPQLQEDRAKHWPPSDDGKKE
jgi:hypothetical protein